MKMLNASIKYWKHRAIPESMGDAPSYQESDGLHQPRASRRESTMGTESPQREVDPVDMGTMGGIIFPSNRVFVKAHLDWGFGTVKNEISPETNVWNIDLDSGRKVSAHGDNLEITEE